MTEQTYQTSRTQKLLALLTVGGFILALSLVGFMGLSRIEEQSRLQVRDTLQSVLLSTHEALYLWLDHRLRVLTGIAQRPDLLVLVEAQLALPRNSDSLSNSPELAQLRAFFNPILKENGDLGMFIIAPDNISIASMRDNNIGTPNVISQKRPALLKRVFAGKPHFIAPISSEILLKDKVGRMVKNQPTMFIAVPVKNAENKVIAALTLRLDPSKDFTHIIQLGRLGNTGETYAIDETGILISESRFDAQLRKAGHLGPFQQTMLNIRVTDPGVNLTLNEKPPIPPNQQSLTLMASEATAGNAGFNTEGYSDYRGVTVFGAWLWDEKLLFAIATEVDAQEALQPYFSTRTIIISIFCMTLLLVSLLMMLLIKLAIKSNQSQQLLNRQLEQRVKERTLALEDAKVKLSIANRELQELATVDSLTGLSNRRFLDEFLEGEWSRCMRDHSPISFVLFDIDYFKLYNDHYGHVAGDECLQQIGRLLLNERIISRPGDLVARYGGEEFAIVLSDTNQEDALLILNKLMSLIEEENIPHQGTLVPDAKHITISAGLATLLPTKEVKPIHLIDLADEALYSAKSKGRNQYQFTTTQVNAERSPISG